MKRSLRPRATAKLSKSLQQHLNMYALAASAAGVGMLALSQAADAKIVYTPAHRVIGSNSNYHIDLNQDKTTDFTISNISRCGTDFCFYGLYQRPRAGNSAVGYIFKGLAPLASALKQGSPIGPRRRFLEGPGGLVEVDVSFGPGSTSTFGPWPNVTGRYLGLKFQINGKTHYGWARLNVKLNFKLSRHTITAILTGYAYETIPGKAIIAGQTKGTDNSVEESNTSLTLPASQRATLGMLAVGAPALSVWRREELAAPKVQTT
jgi:hypothetical protein